MNRLPLFALSAFLHAYIAARLIPSLLDWRPAAVLLALLLAGSMIVIPVGMMLRRRRMCFGLALQWTSLIAVGLFSSLLVLTVLRDMLLLAGAALLWAWPDAFARAGVEAMTAAVVPLAAMAVTLIGLWNARRTAGIVDVEIPIANLPTGLHGFTIAQISDIHVGTTIRGPYVQSIVDAVNGLDADMVAVTGDLVDGSVAELGRHVAGLEGLASRHGTFFVTGNHEYYSGAHAWIRELRRLGLRVLLNEHVVLRHGDSEIVVAGVTDSSAHHFDPAHRSSPERALAGAPSTAPVRVLLAHQPRSAPAAADAGFDLQLSGHTHGGQFWPWNHFVRLQQPFVAGLDRLAGMWIYTSRGTGYWGPPKRFGAPSEITRLRLVPAAE